MEQINLYFDLQLFAEDSGADSNTSENNNVDTANDDVAINTENHDDDYAKYDDEQPFHINDEVTKLVLTANNINPEEQHDDSNNNVTDSDDKANATTQADDNQQTQPVNQIDADNQQQEPIDYKALYEKQQKELAELKQKYGSADNTNNANQNIYQPTQTNNAPPQQQITSREDLFKNIKITPQIAKAMDEVTTKRAMEMTGMTKEDIEGLEYAEDGDEKKLAFENAKQLARNSVTNYVNNALIQQQQARINAQLEREQSIADTEHFIADIKKQNNYQMLDSYITQNYFTTLTPQEQTVVKNSYQRLNNRCGTLADNMIIKNFWNNGVNAYNSQAQANSPANQKVNAVNNKMTQRNKMPRVCSVPSAGSNKNEAWTLDRISTAINSGHWQQIPKDIQEQILLGQLK